MTEYECYMRIFGELIYCVDHYVEKAPLVVLIKEWNNILDRMPE